MWYSWLTKAVERKGTRWRLERVISVVFDIADLQKKIADGVGIIDIVMFLIET